jgi:putative lipoic acid-binding regulatory protein
LTLPSFTDNFITQKGWQAMSGNKKQKLHLEYPCLWIYTIIGVDQDKMQSAVCDIIRDRPCKISLSRQSETAKYISLNVELTVESESHRAALYEALKEHRAIKLVL